MLWNRVLAGICLALLVLMALGLTGQGLSRSALAVEGELTRGRQVALVIGNNDYKHLPKLLTAESDAEAVAEVLAQRYGFQTNLLKNATRMKLLLELNRLRADLEENDSLLIYYAGHGTLERQTQTGYWLPVDAEQDNDINWIANADLTRRLRGMSARHVMIVADSCYSGTLVRSVEVQPATGYDQIALLRRLTEKRSRTAIVSGGLEPVVDSGKGGHSVFANAFLDVLSESNEPLHGGVLFDRLRRRVVLNADQTPQYSDIRQADHEGGALILVPKSWQPGGTPQQKAKLAAIQPDMPTTDKSDAVGDKSELVAEIAFWESIKEHDNPAVFQAYLQQYPDGTFSPLARLRLQELEGGGAAKPAVAPTAEPSMVVRPTSQTMVTTARSNIRSEPSLDGQPIATLARGREVQVTGLVNNGAWFQLQDDEFGTAYIFGKLLVSPEEWAARRQTASVAPRQQVGNGGRSTSPPRAQDASDGPGIRFVNATGGNVAASTKELVQDVVRQTIDARQWRELDNVVITLTAFGVERATNPELFGQQLVKSLFGNLVPSTESRYVHIHKVEVNIATTGRGGSRFSDSALTERHDFTERNQVSILLKTLLETTRRAAGRVSIRLAGGVPPNDTRSVVQGKHKAYYQQ